MTDPGPKFAPPRWYRWALWPLLAVILVGLICLGIALFHVVHGLFTPGLAPTPKPILFTGVACVGGGVVARTLQMIVAVQQDRWSKAHGGADPYRRYDDVSP